MKRVTCQYWLTIVVLSAGLSACTTKSQEAPPLTGPSEFGTSIGVTITPDTLSLDGGSQALVTISAHDSNGQPLRNVTLRVETFLDGVRTDVGTLSARTVVTGNDGRATLTFTAPAANTGGVDSGTVVQIAVTPLGTDFNNAVARSATVRLVPVGVVIPPSGLSPSFTTSPVTPSEDQPVLFDASASLPQGGIATYAWTFGDGTTGSGRTTTHTYRDPGNFFATLTITDTFGRSASTTRTIVVSAGTRPVAVFSVSPTPPSVGTTTNFNAAASTAAPGRSITGYQWSFGDGGTASGQSVTHVFTAAGTFAVTLTVTDDIGNTGVSTQQIQVGTAGGPTAQFTFSPAAPSVNQNVFFNATSSTGGAGRQVTEYSWNFGDGNTGTGVTPVHAYTASGNYTVTLVVTNDAGATATTSSTVTVSAAGTPTAQFTFSPASPSVNENVFFTAASSTAGSGRQIVSYAWNFGDGFSASGVTTSHAYSASATYTVTLVVTDNAGAVATTTRTVVVGAALSPTARLTVSPSQAVINSPVQADGSTSTTQTGQTITNYAFNFGDGSPTVSGSSPRVDHTYTTTGDYTITLTVTDSAGRTNTTSGGVTITASQDPVAVFVYSPNSPVSVGQTVTFDASASRAPQNAVITRYQWQFAGSPNADGACATAAGPVITVTTPTYNHQFGAAGTFCVALTVFDNQGGQNTTFRLITVQP